MISHARLLSYIVGVGVVAAIVLGWGLGVADHDEFVVLDAQTTGEQRSVAAATPELPLFETYAIHATGNPDDGPWVAGSGIYEMGGVYTTGDGGAVSHGVRFGTVGYVEVDQRDVIRRAVDSRFGPKLLHYEVTIRGAISNDDTEYCLTHVVASRGTTDCGVTPILRYLPGARRLDVTLEEEFFGDRRSYEFRFRIDEQGAISRWVE